MHVLCLFLVPLIYLRSTYIVYLSLSVTTPYHFRYARCTRSVSIGPYSFWFFPIPKSLYCSLLMLQFYLDSYKCYPNYISVPPAYYAHLAAFRARYYIEGESDSGSTSTGRASRGRNVDPITLPAIKDNVKEVMFYC